MSEALEPVASTDCMSVTCPLPTNLKHGPSSMIRVHRGLDTAGPKLLYQAERLERLAADMRRIAAGDWPRAEDLNSAPVMDFWSLGSVTIPTLEGISQGHPRIPAGPTTSTEVWAIDVHAGWARTLSRFYRLGERQAGFNPHD